MSREVMCGLALSLALLIFLFSAMEIKIFLGISAEEITKASKNVMTTMGEWELLDITAQKLIIDDSTGLYTDELTFFVGYYSACFVL